MPAGWDPRRVARRCANGGGEESLLAAVVQVVPYSCSSARRGSVDSGGIRRRSGRIARQHQRGSQEVLRHRSRRPRPAHQGGCPIWKLARPVAGRPQSWRGADPEYPPPRRRRRGSVASSTSETGARCAHSNARSATPTGCTAIYSANERAPSATPDTSTAISPSADRCSRSAASPRRLAAHRGALRRVLLPRRNRKQSTRISATTCGTLSPSTS